MNILTGLVRGFRAIFVQIWPFSSATLCKDYTQHQSLWKREEKDKNITSERERERDAAILLSAKDINNAWHIFQSFLYALSEMHRCFFIVATQNQLKTLQSQSDENLIKLKFSVDSDTCMHLCKICETCESTKQHKGSWSEYHNCHYMILCCKLLINDSNV